MYTPVIVQKGRTTTITVGLGFDVSQDTITSEIRTREDQGSEKIATWAVSFASDGTDGELVLTLDNADSATVKHSTGFMDLKRVSGAEPLSIFLEPIPVVFQGTVTA